MNKYLIIIIASLFFASCGSKNSAAKEDARQSIQDRVNNSAPAPIDNSLATTGSVQHYICPNNCEGSGGAAQGTCPVCGTAYLHNQAFHNQPAANAQQAAPPAATNAAGQYHYICSNGCAGGSGTQGTCATCGNALVHNTAFHN